MSDDDAAFEWTPVPITVSPTELDPQADQVVLIPDTPYGDDLPNAAGDLWTANSMVNHPNALYGGRCLSITLCNHDTVIRTFTLYRVEAAGATANNRKIADAIPLDPSQSCIIDWPPNGVAFRPGEKLRGFSSAAATISCFVDVLNATG